MENLTDLEIAKIEAFCKDKATFEAVKKVLFSALYSDGVVEKGKEARKTNSAFSLIANAYSENKSITNDELGAQLRAKFEGVHAILNGFEQLKSIKRKDITIDELVNDAI